MLIRLTLIVAGLLLSLQGHADATSRAEQVSSFVTIVKLDSSVMVEPLFTYQFCTGGPTVSCEIIGSPDGYTQAQIETLSGRWKQAGALSLGVVEVVGGVVVGVYAAATTGAVTAVVAGTGEAGTMLALGLGATAGIAAPTGIFYFVDAINPVRIYKAGGTESKMVRKMRSMLQSDESASVLFESIDNEKVLDFANRVETALTLIEN